MPYKVATGRSLFAQKNYQAKILDMFGSSIVAYWPQNESGGTVSRDIGGRGLNGTYTGVTLRAPGIGDGETAASYDGTTSYNNVYNAGLASAFNSQEGTALLWARITSAGVWTDANNRRILRFAADASNGVKAVKNGTGGVNFEYTAGGTSKSVTVVDMGTRLTYFCFAETWSKSADALKVYLNGVQQGVTQTGLGVWSGSLAATLCNIGTDNTTPVAVFSGSIGPVLLLNRAATAGEIAAASTL